MTGACRDVWFAVFLVQAFLNGANVYGQLETEAMLQVIYSRGFFAAFIIYNEKLIVEHINSIYPTTDLNQAIFAFNDVWCCGRERIAESLG